ncbi:hypothetical protein D3C79_896850 [compost metagenome]
MSELYAKRQGLEVVAHRKIDDEEMRITVAEDALRALKQEYVQWIRDQYYYPVDIIYTAALKEEFSVLSPLENALAHAYKLAGVIFVYVTASPNELGRRYYERGDELWDLEQISKVAVAYERWYHWAQHNHHLVRIDTTDKDLESCYHEVSSQVAIIVENLGRGVF